MAFMRPQHFFTVVLPTTLTGAALIGITTLGEPKNFVNQLISIRREDGRLVFRVVALELVCDECRDRGKPEQCRHMNMDLPYWHRKSSHVDLELIMASRNDDYLREARGLQGSDDSQPIFDGRDCSALMDPANDFVNEGQHFRHLFVSLDPAAGSKNSACAIVSCVYQRRYSGVQCIILGSDMFYGRRPQDNLEAIINHIKHVQANVPGTRDAVVVFIPESNLGFEALHTETALALAGYRGDGFCVMNEDDNRAGIRMNYNVKKLLSFGMEHRLSTRSVSFHRQFFTLSDKQTALTMKKAIVEQLRNFTRYLVYPKTSSSEHAVPKEIFSGKSKGDGQDDLVIALMLNSAMQTRFFSAVGKYQRWH